MSDCAFCDEFADPGPGGRIITATDDWVLIPTVGAFTGGYCLAMPIAHVDAVADLSIDELTAVETKLEAFRERISASYGPAIIAEHGARACDLGAGCCTHAHLHLIPVPQPGAALDAYRSVGGEGVQLGRLAHLPSSVDGPYVYLSPAPGEHFCWPADGFARQFVRRVTAAQHGLTGDSFDWRDHPFTEQQNETLRALRAAFGEGSTSNGARRC